MKLRFWGVRGSIPTPGRETAGIGGNTSCVEVVTDSGEPIILDAGTGLRVFGLDYVQRKDASKVIHLVISHCHWDHIQGFPFFVPAFIPGFTINIYGDRQVWKCLQSQMQPPFFPVGMEMMGADIEFHPIDNGDIEIAGCTLSTFTLVHPQKVFGFRVQNGDKSVVYSTDTEHDLEKALGDGFLDAIKGADALLFDAQYTPDEYSSGREGWGHSTYVAGADIAKKAGIKKLVLFHHEPTHNDAAVEKITKDAQKMFPGTVAAKEGMELEV